MKSGSPSLSFALAFVVGGALMSLVPSCSDSSNKDIGGPVAPSSGDGTRSDLDTGTLLSATRQCTGVEKTMTNVNNDALSDFAIPPSEIGDVEPPVTNCLTYAGSSSTMRFEFEADGGIFSLKFTKTLYASKATANGVTTLDIIFEDGYGLVQVLGTKSSSSTAKINAQVKFYNFPSEEEAYNQALDELRQKCLNGTYTPAYCMGQGPTLPWWKDPNYGTGSSKRLTKARELLSSQGRVLGNLKY